MTDTEATSSLTTPVQSQSESQPESSQPTSVPVSARPSLESMDEDTYIKMLTSGSSQAQQPESEPLTTPLPKKSETKVRISLVNLQKKENHDDATNNEAPRTEVEHGGGGDEGTCSSKCVQWTKVIWALISFWISVADITVIVYLSYLHFKQSHDIEAWVMLLPIMFNFIGIFVFLSDDEDRHEMEKLGCHYSVWKNLMFLPVVGPSFSALKLFSLSLSENEERFERLESLLIRMKQYESYFRAAPEAFIQLTFRIFSWSKNKVYLEEDYWINLCVILSFIALAEANMYSTVIPYYRMFYRDKRKGAWKVDHIRIPTRIGLFFFNFSSIESRLYADAILKATACLHFSQYTFGQVLMVTFLCQFVARAMFYSVFVGFLGSDKQKGVFKDTGVYGAFSYAWRSLFISFDYQSYYTSVFLSFYLENLILIGGSYLVILALDHVDLSDKYILNIYAAISVLSTVLAVYGRFKLRRKPGISRASIASDPRGSWAKVQQANMKERMSLPSMVRVKR